MDMESWRETELKKIIRQCPYCKSIKWKEWFDTIETMCTCKRCGKDFAKSSLREVIIIYK